jgi:two-component system, cell cycle response regulator
MLMHPHGPSERTSTSRILVNTGGSSTWTRYETPARHVEPLPAGTARATISVVSGPDAGRIVPIEASCLVIGRGAESDLQIEDPAVSRAHARIVRTSDGAFHIEDLGSTNGTLVGARRVTVAPLRAGDHVQLGPTALLRFALTDPADERLQVELYESSVRDPLTKTFNRRYLLGRLVAEVAHARRYGTPLAALMLDVDGFKQFNDRYGHFVGDRILCFATAQVWRLLRAGDLLARFGGDEFVVLSRETSAAQAATLADRLRSAVAGMHMSAGGVEVSVTISVGIASLEELGHQDAPEDLVDLADRRLCTAKRAGRNRACAEGR